MVWDREYRKRSTLNHSTGNLILASRQGGGVTPVIIDSETGDSLGLLKTSKPPSEAPTPVWSFSAPKSTWFGTGNTERGLGFNQATGNLIVASRQGGVTPILIDAATGDSVGMLKRFVQLRRIQKHFGLSLPLRAIGLEQVIPNVD